ncbi:hypothetical protein ACVILI_005991 [Mesorhizobium sp. USDA 4775]
MGAGYPSWATLLREIGDELGVRSTDVHDLSALAQWSIQESGGATRVRSVIKEQIGVDHPVPSVLETIARLPTRHIWTTNYDRLIERAFASIRRPLDVVSAASDLALRITPGATRLYKMHGSIDRLDDVVISTDDYELFRKRRGAFLPLLQAHLTSMSMLFVGLSLTDPNIRHVLSLMRESFTEAPPEHFAIVRPPQREDFDTEAEHAARLAQHRLWAKDLRRYGLVAVEIDSYDEVPDLLQDIEREVAAHRVWVSGSWPLNDAGTEAARSYETASRIGREIAKLGRTLVSGSGFLVGPASIAGFLDQMREAGTWDVERRLIARPFPQPFGKAKADNDQWTSLRQELSRLSGAVVFVGGQKPDGVADGVLEEAKLAENAGCFLLPVGATGGAAAQISAGLLGSTLVAKGAHAIRPTDQELAALSEPTASPKELARIVSEILKRVGPIKG